MLALARTGVVSTTGLPKPTHGVRSTTQCHLPISASSAPGVSRASSFLGRDTRARRGSVRRRAAVGSDDAERLDPSYDFAGAADAWAMGDDEEESVNTSGAAASVTEEVVQDDLESLMMMLPPALAEAVMSHPKRTHLLEVVLDLGRRPEARFAGGHNMELLREEVVTQSDLDVATAAVGEFGGDNRAGIQGTLHRISCMRNRRGAVVGLTCRVGRAVSGHVEMIRDLLEENESLLFLGRPGVGKTTVIRELARVLSDELHRRVVIVDTSNEIGGDGDVPHPAIGSARRMQVAEPAKQHRVMIEAVENHMPEVIIVDEIGTEAEALACRTIAERGVMLIGTAHGQLLENLIKNPSLSDLVGGVHTVTLGDDEARLRGTSKSVMERKAPPTFPVLLELRERQHWVTHRVEESVDATLQGKRPHVQVRTRDAAGAIDVSVQLYDKDPAVGGRSRAIGELEADAAFGNLLSSESPYSWAQRLGAVPDKDLLEEVLAGGVGYDNGRMGANDRFSYMGKNKRGSRRGGGKIRAVKGGR